MSNPRITIRETEDKGAKLVLYLDIDPLVLKAIRSNSVDVAVGSSMLASSALTDSILALKAPEIPEQYRIKCSKRAPAAEFEPASA